MLDKSIEYISFYFDFRDNYWKVNNFQDVWLAFEEYFEERSWRGA
jgi:hypothetical protein